MSYTHQFGKDGYFGMGEGPDAGSKLSPGRDNIPREMHEQRVAEREGRAPTPRTDAVATFTECAASDYVVRASFARELERENDHLRGVLEASPKPLMCRLAALMAEWRQTRDNMKARGEDDAAMAVECCMETLHQDVSEYLKELKSYRERTTSPLR